MISTLRVDKMFILPDAGKLKAFCDVSINGEFVVKGLRIIQGKKALFVSMPQEIGKDNIWYDQIVCTSDTVYEALANAVLDHYAAQRKGTNE
jgi:stage V sporulation protein G